MQELLAQPPVAAGNVDVVPDPPNKAHSFCVCLYNAEKTQIITHIIVDRLWESCKVLSPNPEESLLATTSDFMF